MPAPQIPGVVFQPHSHSGMQRGINQLIDTVRPTLGPTPRVVAVEANSRLSTPELLDNAGVISRRIVQLADRDADMGAMLVRNLLWTLQDEVGDGTATAAVLFQAVYNRGQRYVAAGGNAMQLRRHLEVGAQAIVDELQRMTAPVAGKAALANLAESLCFDRHLAQLLGEIFDIVGEYGHVEVRTGQRRELERQYVEGMFWKSKVLSPHFYTDQVKQRADLANAALLISDLEIDEPRALIPVLDLAADAGIRSLVIIASKIDERALAFLLAANRTPDQLRVLAVETPGLGVQEQLEALEDLAVLTGGRALIKAAGDTLRGLKLEDLGEARRAWGDRQFFGIVGGKGDPRQLRAHITKLRGAFAAAEQPQARKERRQRLGKLLGGSAVLLVGAATELEMTGREALARRTADIVRTALREGVLPGGGIALLACRDRLRRMLAETEDGDAQAAYRILLQSLEEPIRTIVANAGFDPGAVMAQVLQADAGCGFDVRSGEVVDMRAAGIFDVAGAQTAAVRGAIGSAALALTVDTLIHKQKPEATPGRP